MKNLISVIVPIYKVEKYLKKCVDSIINQTYTNLEIILVNDGSPDGCGEICTDYVKLDSRVIVINKENGGLSSARNYGLKNANGRYVCFIDSDDWIDKEYINTLYENLIKYDANVSMCGFKYEYENKIAQDNFKKTKTLSGKEAITNLYSKDYIKMTVAWNKLYKKEIFDLVNYEEGIIHEDENIIHEIYYFSEKVVCINKDLYHYRIRENSITTSKFSLKQLDKVYVYEKRLSFFNKKSESLFYSLTLEVYFRVLFSIYCNLYDSDLKNKSIYLEKYKYKLDANLNEFSKLKNKKIANRILLSSYKIHPKVGITSNKILNSIKKVIS